MKRLAIIYAIAILLMASVPINAPAANFCKSSGLQTSSGVILATHGQLCGILIITDGTNAATVITFNNTSGSGTALFKGTVAGASNFGGATYEVPISASGGIYLTLSGTGASAIVYYAE